MTDQSQQFGLASIPGNTNPGIEGKLKKKFKNFQLTLNYENDNIENSEQILLEKYKNLMNYLLSLKYLYIISCKEKNKKGFYHIHIFIQFNTQRSLSIKKCQGAHIEGCRGNVYENINYIKKDGIILDELGTPNIIRNSISIRQVINSTNNDELLDFDIKYINCINKAKNTSIQWNQPTFNCKKQIITNLILNTNNHNFTFVGIDFKKRQFINLATYIAIDMRKYNNLNNDNMNDDDENINSDIKLIEEFVIIQELLNKLQDKYNLPLQTNNGIFYANDVKAIHLVYN